MLGHLVDHLVAHADPLVLKRAIQDDLVLLELGRAHVGVDDRGLESAVLVMVCREVGDVQGVGVIAAGDGGSLDD